jgi:hypothetical protein
MKFNRQNIKVKLRPIIESILNEASQIDLKEVPDDKSKIIKMLEKILDGRHNTIFEGIHGYIVEIKVGMGRERLELTELQQLIKLNIRWIQFDSNTSTFSVGF